MKFFQTIQFFVLTYFALLLMQYLIAYLFFCLLIFSSRLIAAWFGDSANFNLFLSLNYLISVFLILLAGWLVAKFARVS